MDEIARKPEIIKQYETYLRGQKGLAKKTVINYLTDLQPFFKFLHKTERSFNDLDRPLLRQYLAQLMSEGRGRQGGYARASVARKLIVLRSLYSYLSQQGIVPINPIPRNRSMQVKVEKRLPRFLTEREVNKLLEAPDMSKQMHVRDRAILELLYASGMRLSELAGLSLSDIDHSHRKLRVLGKGYKERIVLIGQPGSCSLRAYLEKVRPNLLKTPNDAIFLNRYGQRLSHRTIHKTVRHFAMLAGLLPGVHPHTLRHTFATHLLDGGADLRVVQELLGHVTPATTQIYTHVTRNKTRKVYLSAHPLAKKETNNDSRNSDT